MKKIILVAVCEVGTFRHQWWWETCNISHTVTSVTDLVASGVEEVIELLFDRQCLPADVKTLIATTSWHHFPKGHWLSTKRSSSHDSLNALPRSSVLLHCSVHGPSGSAWFDDLSRFSWRYRLSTCVIASLFIFSGPESPRTGLWSSAVRVHDAARGLTCHALAPTSVCESCDVTRSTANNELAP